MTGYGEMAGYGGMTYYTGENEQQKKMEGSASANVLNLGAYASSDRAASRARNGNVKQLVLTGLFFAIALVLAIVENSLPSLPIPVPGVKFGLSNIAVMFALFFLAKSQAYAIAVLKGIFVLMTRGLIAGILSLSGGLVSLTLMLILILVFKDRISYLIISVVGAIAHNLGQFAAITFIYTGFYMAAYLPVLAISGVVAGIITATLLRVIIPVFKKLV